MYFLETQAYLLLCSPSKKGLLNSIDCRAERDACYAVSWAALRCQKAGIDAVVASGHERGFHASREPVHSIVLLPAVVDVSRGISGEAR